MNSNYYGIYDNGVLLYEGYPKEIEKYLDAPYHLHLKKFADTGGKLQRKYEVRYLNPPVEEVKEEEPPAYEYEFVLTSVVRNGNSIVNRKNKVDEVLGYLNQKGYECIARYVPKTKYESEFWVIERC